MYRNLLNIALGHYGCPCCQEKHQPKTKIEEDAPIVISDTKPKITATEPTLTDFIDIDEDPDIEVLKREYGELYEGKVIEIGLSEACKLLGRTRIRVDAFKGIISKLHRDYGVTLIIKSRKSK